MSDEIKKIRTQIDAIDSDTKLVSEKLGSQWFKEDEARNDEFGSKVVQGIISTAIFAAVSLPAPVISA